MKILIKYNQESQEYFDAIAALSTVGHFVKPVQQPLYLECTQNQYDVLVINENDNNEEITNVVEKFKLKLVVLGKETSVIFGVGGFGANYFTFPRFANTLKYKTALPDESLLTNLYVHCTDLETAEFAQNASTMRWKMKVSSIAPLHCPNFVGLVNPDNIMKLAKSANVTITNDRVLLDTLLYNGILAFPVKDASNSGGLKEEEYIAEQQKLIIPINNLLLILNEKFSYTG